ncbi:hypothetical protein NZK35_09030 [Stieleria sp. ICT_E10.1]|uniref:hypothetical protein n=1 Tax=Stieleria sedimenti TaxID=2976331 RepID=UPI0021801ADF|nr:hypothetical protein [Stieleria sedimenti]MCS7466784.1 hypothetical protein [Stieleria sedimenti]
MSVEQPLSPLKRSGESIAEFILRNCFIADGDVTDSLVDYVSICCDEDCITSSPGLICRPDGRSVLHLGTAVVRWHRLQQTVAGRLVAIEKP